jgi:formylglycine-generating enzyme required for sulfatase activity
VLNYFDAAAFCNWLSAREKIPADQWCYLPGDVKGTLTLAPDYWSRRGYRLPTVQEWEYAARAGTTTERYLGQSDAHLGDYAWYRENTHYHPEPVGVLRPNDFGLFDVLGNVMEWCHDPDPPHDEGCGCGAGRGSECRKTPLESLKGGSFAATAPNQRVNTTYPSFRAARPENRWVDAGFRVVTVVP